MAEFLQIDDLCFESTDNIIFTSNGDYMFCYSLSLPPRYSLSPEQIEAMRVSWIKALQYLPDGTYVHKSDVFKSEKYDASTMPQKSFIQIATAQHFGGRDYLGHHSYVFLIFPSDTRKYHQLTNPFSLRKSSLKDSSINLDELKRTASEFVTSLTGELIKMEPLDYDCVSQFWRWWWNGLQDNSASDVEFEHKHINLGKRYAGITAITNEQSFPEDINAQARDPKFSRELNDFIFTKGLADDLGLTLTCDHIYNQIIRLESKETVINQIIKTRDNFKAVSKFGYRNGVAAAHLTEYIEWLQNTDNSGLRFASCHNNIIYFADSTTELARYDSTVTEQIKKLDIYPYIPTGKRLQNLFINTFPNFVPYLDEASYYLTYTDIATALIINSSNYGDDLEGIYFQDRLFNRPFRHDFWDEKKHRKVSKNYGIIAPTGRGKSVLINSIVSGLADSEYPIYNAKGEVESYEGVITVIVDIGRSYEKLSLLYDPKDIAYFRYVPGQPLGLNPFAITDNKMPNELRIESICTLVWILIKKSISEVTKTEASAMRAIVEAYFDAMIISGQPANCSWHTFYSFIEKGHEDGILLEALDIKDEFINIDEFLLVGRDFTTGIYKNVFAPNSEKSQALVGKKIVIFEYDDVQENEVLLPVMLQSTYSTIQQLIWDRNHKGQVIFEELAKSLHFPGIMSSVAFYAQAIRKQNGMLAIVLQNISQLPDNPQGNSVMGNLETIITLPISDAKVIEAIAKKKDLSRHELTMIKSLKSQFAGDRKYTEIFIKEGDSSLVVRLELPAKVLAVFNTDPESTTLLMKLYDKNNGDMIKALDEYLQIKPSN